MPGLVCGRRAECVLVCASAPSASGEYSFHVTQAVLMLVSPLNPTP